jgi:thiol:disulfide interchange protein DsbG
MNSISIRRALVHALALMAVFNLGFFSRPVIDSLRSKDAFALLETSARISQAGVEGAPRVFVTFDPYCKYCHKLYGTLAKRVEAGDLQVEWVPVGFMNADSTAVAAEMLAATDPSIALSRWFGAEVGTSPVVPRGAVTKEFAARVASNTDLIRALVGKNAAPAVFYRDASGVTQLTVGIPADLDAWLKGLST